MNGAIEVFSIKDAVKNAVIRSRHSTHLPYLCGFHIQESVALTKEITERAKKYEEEYQSVSIM
jgi:hypothetical protein